MKEVTLGIGGAAGDGLDKTGDTFAKTASRLGLYLYAYNSYQSIIRGGHIDVTVLGSYQVSEKGDFANWRTAGRKGGSIGGAMDLAVGAKRVWIVMAHTTREGKPRLMKRCTLPVTAIGVVSRIVTDLGLFGITKGGFILKEIAPNITPQEVQSVTEAQLLISEKYSNYFLELRTYKNFGQTKKSYF